MPRAALSCSRNRSVQIRGESRPDRALQALLTLYSIEPAYPQPRVALERENGLSRCLSAPEPTSFATSLQPFRSSGVTVTLVRPGQ
jgi:hypothetical protein